MLYNFPKFYNYIVSGLVSNVPWASDPDHLSDLLQIQAMEAGSLILDIACGTGLLTLLLAEQRSDLQIIGVDVSHQMLVKAEEKAHALQLNNVTFIEKSVLSLARSDIPGTTFSSELSEQQACFDMIICSHGFSAMQNYQAVFAHTLPLLKEGGSYVVLDLYYPKRTLVTWLATYIIDQPFFGANQFRKPFLLLQQSLANFEMVEKPKLDFGFLPSTYYVAKGIKRKKKAAM